MSDVGSLTDRQYWIDYWNNTPDDGVDDDYFDEVLRRLPPPGATLIELGGFPGYVAAWFQKRGFRTAILDFVILEDRLRAVERTHGLPAGAIGAIECDLMGDLPDARFDVVASFGLAEHFDDLQAVVARHVALAERGGTVVITMPNFRGFHGLAQRFFDPANYARHNVRSMRTDVMRDAAAPYAESLDIFYFGRPKISLEDLSARPGWLRFLFRNATRLMRILGWRGRWFSPHVALVARLRATVPQEVTMHTEVGRAFAGRDW